VCERQEVHTCTYVNIRIGIRFRLSSKTLGVIKNNYFSVIVVKGDGSSFLCVRLVFPFFGGSDFFPGKHRAQKSAAEKTITRRDD
jgi:hypothetical protein